MKTKNQANTKNLRFIPTWKIEAILNSPNCTGIDGRDYGPVEHELKDILFERKNRLQEWELRKKLHGLDRAVKEMSPSKYHEDKPTERKGYEIVELICEVRDYWKIAKGNGGFEIVEIPPQIMAF